MSDGLASLSAEHPFLQSLSGSDYRNRHACQL